MGSANGLPDYTGTWAAFKHNGYKTMSFDSNHVKLIDPDGGMIGIYHLPDTLPENVRCSILVDAVAEHLEKLKT